MQLASTEGKIGTGRKTTFFEHKKERQQVRPVNCEPPSNSNNFELSEAARDANVKRAISYVNQPFRNRPR